MRGLLALLDRPWVTGLFAVVLALLTWDYLPIVPAAGLDGSWIVGLNLAAADGADHGTEFVFTYGPLGFLEQPSVSAGTPAALGGVWVLGLRVALAATYLRAARRSFPWPAAAALAFAGMVLIPPAPGAVPLALALAWALLALQEREPGAWTATLVWGGGALAGIEALVKLNVGITILAIVAIAAVAAPGFRARNAAALAGVLAVTAAIGWFASGQGLGNVTDYVRSSFELVSGYSSAMQAENPEVSWDAWGALGLAIATIAATIYAGAGLPAIRRFAMVAIVGLVLLSLEKYSFVRHDAGHIGPYFGTAAAIWLALRWSGAGRALAGAGLAATAVIFFAVSGQTFSTTFEPRLALDQLRTLIEPGRRGEARDAARANLRAAYGLDPEILSRVGDAPVDVRPWELGIAWAYDLNWRPLPVIQDYSAYTPELDRLDAEALASGDGPRFVIRHLTYDGGSQLGLDGRLTSFDSPLVTRTLLCEYVSVFSDDAYQLLERSPDRCGPERALETVEAAYGERVEVPRAGPGEAVFARIDGAGGGGVERLRTLLYREALRTIDFESGATRLQTANAEQGLLLRAPPSADLPSPFELALGARRISIDSEGGFATSEQPLTYSFFAVPIGDLPAASGRAQRRPEAM